MQRQSATTLLALLVGCAVIPATHAYSVNVVSSQPVTRQIMPELATIQGIMEEMVRMQTATGTAITQNSEKLATVIAQDGQATRQQMIFSNETHRLEEARKSFSVPDSICSESASGIAAESRRAAASAAARLSQGGGVSSKPIRERLSRAADSPVREAYDSAGIHAGYCTEAEYARFGGTDVCPAVGDLPGGDSQVRSLYQGAGTADTPAALTWDQKQIDAATAYMKNTARPSAGRAPGKGEVGTQTGRTYVGLQNEYNGIIDAASHPQLSLIADSTPNEATRGALTEALQSPSAAAYFDRTASSEARTRGHMSQREFEAFEAGRRYANTDWQQDLQGMEGDNLLRELLRTTALLNWQMNDLKEQIRQGNVIAGQQLALAARQYYGQRLGERKMKDDNSIDEKKPAPRLRRIGDIGINLFAPLAETRWMLRSCRHMLDQHKTRLKRLMPDRQPESPVCMTWEEAVRASGLTVDELDRRLRRRRMFWRTGFWLMMIPVLLLCGMALAATALPVITLIRILVCLLLMSTIAALCASKALIASYRLWQLNERRVSEDEQGTFPDYLQARHGWKQATWLAITHRQY